MKRILITAVVTLVIMCSACSCIKILKNKKLSGVMVQKSMELKSFSSMEIKNNLDVKFVKGDRPYIHITGDSVLVNDLNVDFDNDRIKLYMNSKFSYSSRDNEKHLKITITSDKFPSILYVSGSSEFETNDHFESKYDVDIRVSGASEIKGVNLTAKNLKIDVTGASEIERCNIAAENLWFNVSGASEMGKIDVNVLHTTTFDISGASDIEARGTFGETKLRLSGASEADIDGHFGLLDMNLSGASEMEVRGTARNIISNTSGASTINKKVDIIK